MRKEWDTIVVGAGIGGLTAAAKLVREGQRVLVLDRNPHPGGTAYVYRRKGFAFPMGPLGFSHPERIKSILSDLGEDEPLHLFRVHYRIKAFNLDLPLSLPSSQMVRELSAFFPSDAQGVARFFQDIERTLSVYPFPDPAVNRSLSAAEYLHGIIKDWRLRRVLGSLGTQEPYSNLSLLAAQWNLMINEGIWYPETGMGTLCEKLERAVTGHPTNDQPVLVDRKSPGSGEIALDKEIAGIRVSKGRALGVTLRDGTQIDSAAVISNADYKTTFLTLLDPNEVTPKWHRAVRQSRQTGSVLQVCLGVDSSRADLSCFRDAARLIYRRDHTDLEKKEEIDWSATEVDPETLCRRELEVSLWSKDDKTLAPEGKDVIVIRAEADYSHFARYKLGWRKRSPAYLGYKTRLGRAFVREAEHLIPGLENSVLVMDVATPLTFEDQGGRSGGAVAGWSWDYQDFRDSSPRELVRTPIRGLYMANYQAYSALFLGGIPTAMESGKRAAEAVLTHADPTEEILIPGADLLSLNPPSKIIKNLVGPDSQA
jgi:phytoene dehydrogenase-like protein